MNYFICLLSVLLFCNKSFGQECDLQKDNKNYLLNLNYSNSVSNKIIIIKEKLLRDRFLIPDSTYSVCVVGKHEFKYSALTNKWKNQYGNDCGKKILHYIFYKKGKDMIELDETLFPNNIQILEFLNQENVDKILNLDSNESKTLFGERGFETNAIIIYTNDKEIEKKILERRKKNGR